MGADIKSRIMQSSMILGQLKALWKVRLRTQAKLRYLRSQVFSVLTYGSEAGNHTKKDLNKVASFLKRCQVLLVERKRIRGTRNLKRLQRSG